MTALRDPEQMREALNRANEVRMHIAGFKRDIAGRTNRAACNALIDLLLNPERDDDGYLGSAKVRDLICAVPGFGTSRAETILRCADIYRFDRRLRDLSPRQRSLIAGLLHTASRNYQGSR